MENLENLPRQEGSGDCQGQILAPGLFKIETDSLCRTDTRINEGEYPYPAQNRVIDQGRLFQQKVDEARFRKLHDRLKLGQKVLDVLVKKSERSHPDSDK